MAHKSRAVQKNEQAEQSDTRRVEAHQKGRSPRPYVRRRVEIRKYLDRLNEGYKGDIEDV